MKNLIFALLLCLSTAAVTAQESISFGPVVGVNFSKMADVAGDTEFKTGFVIGGQLTHSNINNWGVGGAILYSKEGVDIISNGVETEVGLTYLRVPVKGFVFFRDFEDAFRPKIFAGPSFAYLLGSETNIAGSNDEVDTKDMYKSFDLGLTIGTGFNARIAEGTWFNFDAGYTHGLLDVSEFGDASNRGFTVTAGVAFGF